MIAYDPFLLAEPRVPHERDCAPCEAAKKIATAVAAVWDPNDSWEYETPYPPYRDAGMSILDDLAHRAAEVLHDFPIGGARC